MFQFLQKKFIKDLLITIREFIDKALASEEESREHTVDNKFPSKKDIEAQMKELKVRSATEDAKRRYLDGM